MSNGGSRVLVPNTVRKMILHIKEITGKHSEDEIYAMLRECDMDPNETTQRLLYLDTFHEVKKKRDRRKVNLNSKVSEESKRTVGTQRRVAKGSRGNYSYSYPSHGAGIGKSESAREENVVGSTMEGGVKYPLSALEKTKNNSNHHVPNSLAISVNEPAKVSCDISNKESATLPPAGVSSSSVVVPCISVQALDGDAVRQEIKSQSRTESNATNPDGNKLTAVHDVSNNVEVALEDVSSSEKMIKESPIIEKEEPLESSQVSSSLNGHIDDITIHDGQLLQPIDDHHKAAGSSESLTELNMSVEEETSKLDKKLQKLNISAYQPVVFPDNLCVPEHVKNGFIFGSLGATFEDVEYVNGLDDSRGSSPATESLKGNDESAKETSRSFPDASSTGQADCPDHSQSQDNLADLKDSISPSAAHKYDLSKQEMTMPQGGPQHLFVHAARNYGFSFIQPMIGNRFVQFEGLEPQVGNSQVSSSPGSMPTITPSGVGQPPITLSPPPYPLCRQPYPPNYFPFGPYFPPFYMASNAQQFIGHGGFSPQPSAATTGIKFPASQSKPGLNGGYLTQFGLPSSYGPYNPSVAMNSGNPAGTGSEDLTASESKEVNVYTTIQQFESPLVWLPPGRDVPSLPANSLYNHVSLGQNAAFTGPVSGIYRPAQTLAATPTLLQHSNAVAGPIETIGPVSGAYQQPRHAVNWNS
ncbi:hypothetical protein NMG60_11037415 [Bertholletia excelsa]